jgi:hypothetical protein
MENDMKRLALSFALVGALSACQPELQAEVTRFYSLPPPLPGKSFAISPDGPQASDLEFQHYALQVTAALQGKGLTPVAVPATSADVVVQVHYGTYASRTEVYSDPAPMWGYAGRGWHGWGPPPPQINSTTIYPEYLSVDMFDGPAWRAGEKRAIFQGRVVGDSGVRDLNVAMPYLVQALFQNFPGTNGLTERVSISLPN